MLSLKRHYVPHAPAKHQNCTGVMQFQTRPYNRALITPKGCFTFYLELKERSVNHCAEAVEPQGTQKKKKEPIKRWIWCFHWHVEFLRVSDVFVFLQRPFSSWHTLCKHVSFNTAPRFRENMNYMKKPSRKLDVLTSKTPSWGDRRYSIDVSFFRVFIKPITQSINRRKKTEGEK